MELRAIRQPRTSNRVKVRVRGEELGASLAGLLPKKSGATVTIYGIARRAGRLLTAFDPAVSEEDVTQEVYYALLKAASKRPYDKDRGASLDTWANMVGSNHLRDCIRFRFGANGHARKKKRMPDGSVASIVNSETASDVSLYGTKVYECCLEDKSAVSPEFSAVFSDLVSTLSDEAERVLMAVLNPPGADTDQEPEEVSIKSIRCELHLTRYRMTRVVAEIRSFLSELLS